MRLVQLVIVSACVVLSATAYAQVAFPPDPMWTALRCSPTAPMTDPFADHPGALDDRDLVGDPAAPAGFRSADTQYLYLRLRLEEDPAPGGMVRPASWGMLFDLDDNLTGYELAVVASGIGNAAGAVSVYTNQTTTLLDDPNDPADLPAVATYPFVMNARTLTAPGSSYGANADFFLDFAVPWTVLTLRGLDRGTRTYVWAVTSSAASSFDGDITCYDGAGGPAHLAGTASDRTTGDPAQDPGSVPGGEGRLEGGGGCTAGGAGSPLAALPALAFLGLRRRRRTAR